MNNSPDEIVLVDRQDITGDATLGCPQCDALIIGYDSSYGYSMPVIDPHTLEVRHLVGNADDIFANPGVRPAPGHQPTREYAFDRVTLQPCGHVIEGCDAHRLATRIRAVVDGRRRAAAEQTIAAQQQLLGAAESAGHGVLAEGWRRAVRTGSADARGLLASLRLLCPQDDAEVAP